MFSSIVIAGGALKVISALGCIKYMEEKGLIDPLKNCVGTSAGSFVCFLIVLGFSFVEMLEFLYTNLQDPNISKLDATEVLNMLDTYGMSSGKNLELLVQRALYKKLKVIDITFLELAKTTGKNLVVCVSNLSKERAEYFSVDTTPTTSVVMSIRVSCCIPILFAPFLLNDCYYMDGCLYNNFPMDYFVRQGALKDILGINILYKKYQSTQTFFSYAFFIVNSLLDKANHKSYDDEGNNIVTLELQEEDDWFSLTEMSIKFPKEKWATYVQMGYQKIKDKLG